VQRHLKKLLCIFLGKQGEQNHPYSTCLSFIFGGIRLVEAVQVI
jgi:hypothetical protein